MGFEKGVEGGSVRPQGVRSVLTYQEIWDFFAPRAGRSVA